MAKNSIKEGHRPVDCSIVSQWDSKNKAENMNRILVTSKACPNCQQSIQKNQGYMHMTCSDCKFEFCWLCFGSWSDHGGKVGTCNSYLAKQEGSEDEARDLAKNSLERYTHYFERWDNNQKSRALAELHQVQCNNLRNILSETQLSFILEAWQQIIDCRLFLKWTYAYGYYIPQNDTGTRSLFEYLQGVAEAGLEGLQMCAEKDLSDYLLNLNEETDASLNFKPLHAKLIKLTRLTRQNFEQLATAFDRGLPKLNSEGCSTSATGPTADNDNVDGCWEQ